MDDIDLFFTGELGDLHRAQDAERMPDRNVKDVLGRKKIEAMLPIACRPERDEHIVAALLEAAAEIDNVPLRAAVVPRR